jgi:hypothetical protein
MAYHEAASSGGNHGHGSIFPLRKITLGHGNQIETSISRINAQKKMKPGIMRWVSLGCARQNGTNRKKTGILKMPELSHFGEFRHSSCSSGIYTQKRPMLILSKLK